LDSLLQFVVANTNCVLAGYWEKVINSILCFKTDAFLRRLYDNELLVASLVRQCESESFSSVIARVICSSSTDFAS
jgi:hypothetical protein